MKIGCCVSYKDKAKVAKAVELGFDYMESALNSMAAASPADIVGFADALRENKTSCPVVNCMFPGSLRLTGPDVDYAAVDDYLAKTLELTAPVGYKLIVFGSGGSRKIPEGFSYDAAFEQLAVLCADHIAPAMKKYGLVCAVEELNKLECNILNTCAETMKLVKAVEKPEIRLLVDYYHAGMEHEPLEPLTGWGPYIAHVHIASPLNKREYPRVGDGEDYRSFFDILRKAGYKSEMVSIEGRDNGEFIRASIDALAYLKTL